MRRIFNELPRSANGDEFGADDASAGRLAWQLANAELDFENRIERYEPPPPPSTIDLNEPKHLIRATCDIETSECEFPDGTTRDLTWGCLDTMMREANLAIMAGVDLSVWTEINGELWSVGRITRMDYLKFGESIRVYAVIDKRFEICGVLIR